jgi:hypothetical protein
MYIDIFPIPWLISDFSLLSPLRERGGGGGKYLRPPGFEGDGVHYGGLDDLLAGEDTPGDSHGPPLLDVGEVDAATLVHHLHQILSVTEAIYSLYVAKNLFTRKKNEWSYDKQCKHQHQLNIS